MRRQLLAAVLLGALLGGAAAAGGAARTIEALRLARDAAVQELEQVRRELAQERSERDGPGARIAGMDLLVDHTDRRVALEVERRLARQLQPLRGRPVAALDPISFYSSVHGQLVTVDGVTYRLRLLGAVIAPRLLLHIQVEGVPSE